MNIIESIAVKKLREEMHEIWKSADELEGIKNPNTDHIKDKCANIFDTIKRMDYLFDAIYQNDPTHFKP